MPIQVISDSTPIAAKEVAPKKFKPNTKFCVVGYEEGKTLFHTINDKENETVKNMTISGVLTAKELQDLGINVQDWIERNLICQYNKYVPSSPIEPVYTNAEPNVN